MLASDASASQYLKVGIFDDAQVLYGTPEQVFPLLKSTGSSLVRANLWWAGPGISVAKRRPAHPRNPADPAYDWSTYDRTVTFAANNGMQVVFSILGTPRWANGGQGWNSAADDRSRHEGFRDRRGDPLLRQVRRARRQDHPAREQLARLERAEQPRLPDARSTCGRARPG